MMNERAILVKGAFNYLTCEMNDSQFSFRTLSSHPPNTLIEVGTLIDVKEINTNILSKHGNESDEFIPIVCLDGLLYALQNGQLSELDLSKLESNNGYENEEKEIDVKSDNVAINQQESMTNECSKNSCKSEREGSMMTAVVTDYRDSEKCKLLSEQRNDLQIHDECTLNANDFVEVVAAFKCKICPFTSQDRGQLLKHFENIHANLPRKKIEEKTIDRVASNSVKLLYMCGECSGCFPSMESCREHMISDHQLMDRAPCNKVRDETFPNSRRIVNTKATYVEHAKKRKKTFNSDKVGRHRQISEVLSVNYENNKKNVRVKERNVKCFYRGCLHKFSTEEMMQKHVVCHIDNKSTNIFKCNICDDMKFTKWKECCSHLWKKHDIDIDLLCCNICNAYKSLTSVKLLTHMRVHSENRDYECRDCGKRFKQSSQLRNHRVMHMDRKDVDGPRWYTSKTCEMCGKIYADSKCLKNHIQAVHSKLRPYVCNVCGHASARKAMLQMHLRQHTGDKPFNCDICDFKTGDHNSLRRHIMRHTGVRPYKCPHCSYSAIQSSSYKNHLRAKHPTLSGLFTCEICRFKTVKKESYVEHMGDHAKGLIKTPTRNDEDSGVEVFPGNMAAAHLIYSCLGAYSEVDKTIEASLMSSSTSVDGTLQTITIQIPSTHLDGSLPMTAETTIKKNTSTMIQEEEETMHCFLKIPHEEEENIDTGGITIPAESERAEDPAEPAILNVD